MKTLNTATIRKIKSKFIRHLGIRMPLLSPLIVCLMMFVACSEEDEPTITITASDLIVTIAENPEPGQSLGTIQATASSGSLTFEISSQSLVGAFAIDPSSGAVTVGNADLFDFESTTELTASVIVASGNTTEQVAVNVTLTDVSDPMITASNFEVTIDENPTVGLVLGSIQASTDQGTLAFRLGSEGTPSAFNIDAASGELTVADATLFDFEVATSISTTAFLSVGDIEQFVTVVVNLSNVNEITAPADIDISVNENPTVGQELATIEASADLDAVTFELTSVSIADAIQIGTSGVISVKTPAIFDFETNTSVTAAVTVSSEGATSKEVAISIVVNDVSELSLLEEALVYLPLDKGDLNNSQKGDQFNGIERGAEGGLSVYTDRNGNGSGAVITSNGGGFSIPDWHQNSAGTGHNGTFTIALWVRIEEATSNRRTRPIWELNCGAAPAIGLFMVNEINQNAGRLFIRQGSASGGVLASYNNNPLLGLNSERSPWVFVAVSYEEGVAMTYKIISPDDSSLNFTQTITGDELLYTAGAATENQGILTFGQRTCSSTLTIPMALDDILIYDRALSATEIDQLYELLEE
ncbi:MAG: hypothetical protein R8G66_12375 [Cytophagales bacterium]|nr:hypothetical protein [Cytophagales bacterium]